MAAKLITVQATDYNGAILSGALLNVYEAGTTTRRAIYQDSGLSVALTNPAVATSDGAISAWVDDASGNIKITLTNAAGSATYFSQDAIDPTAGNFFIYPVGGGDQGVKTTDTVTFAGVTVGNWSLPSSAGAVGEALLMGASNAAYWGSASGAQVSTFKVFDISDYGAVVDGATDDSTAVQAAVTAAEAAGGGYVYFPAGTTLCDGISAGSNVVFLGEGRGVSIAKLPNSASLSTRMFENANTDSDTSARTDKDLGFIGLTIDGNSENQTVNRWLQDWNDNSTINFPENDYTANGGGIGDSGAANIANDDYIATSQSGTASVALTLANTTMPVAKVLSATTSAAARRLRVVSAGDDSGITFAVVGTDFAGAALNETISGANAGAAQGERWFKTVASVTPSGNTASTVEIGIEEYDIGSAASAGRRNPNYETAKTLIRLRKCIEPFFINCEMKNHKGSGISGQGCLRLRVEKSLFDDVGKNDGPFFPIYTQSLGDTSGNITSFAESEHPYINDNRFTNLERGAAMFQPLIGGQFTNNVITGFQEAAVYCGNLHDSDDDTDAVCLSQTPSGAGNLTLNGVRVSGGAAIFAGQRAVVITSSANLSARTLTITGTDGRGDALIETVTGPNGTTIRSKGLFATVTQIAIDAAAGGALTVGIAADEMLALIAGNTIRGGVISDIISFGVEISGGHNILIRDNHFEHIDEGAIETSGSERVRILSNTFKNCCMATRAIPYGPFSERYSFNIGEPSIAGDATARNDYGYIAVGTKSLGGKDVEILHNTFEDDYLTGSGDPSPVQVRRSGAVNLSGYHLVAFNTLVPPAGVSWAVVDDVSSSVFINDSYFLVFANRGSDDSRVGYDADFTALDVGDGGLVYNKSTGRTGVGTDSPTRKFEVVDDSDVVARIVSSASTAKLRFVASGTTTGATEPEIRVAANTMLLRANNITHITLDGSGNADLGGNLQRDGTQILTTQQAAISDASGGSTVDTEARAQLNLLLAAMRTHGLIAT